MTEKAAIPPATFDNSRDAGGYLLAGLRVDDGSGGVNEAAVEALEAIEALYLDSEIHPIQLARGLNVVACELVEQLAERLGISPIEAAMPAVSVFGRLREKTDDDGQEA
jgi:hypothetical protein